MCDQTARQRVVLPLDTTAPASARAWLLATGCPQHASALLDDALLLVSELVTNAVRYGGPPVELAVECDGTGLQVGVRDGSRTLPVPRVPALDDESGRGFVLLEQLTDRWGVDPHEEPVGKEVWFVLRPPG